MNAAATRKFAVVQTQDQLNTKVSVAFLFHNECVCVSQLDSRGNHCPLLPNTTESKTFSSKCILDM